MNSTNKPFQNDELVQKLTEIVLDNLDNEQFGVSVLAEQVGIDRSNLHRKIKLLTKKSLSQFIREIRLNEALKLLKEEQVTVSEAAYRVGFNNPSYFNSCFHDHYGFPPGEAKQVNLENTPRYKKSEESPGKHRFSSVKKYVYMAIFFFLVIVSMATVLFLKRDKYPAEEKSIAVLPFINDSPDEENAYFINGLMDEIILNLQAIKELRVPGRTSIEQYRNPSKSIPEIAKELDVNYIVEASGQKYGNTFVLRVQLLKGETDRHLWGESYEQEIKGSPEVLIRIQSQIAESIAAELQAIITPEEKQLIEKIPTTSLTAYYFYQRGREENEKYWSDNANLEALERAENLYYKALEYDSTFALAYTGLAKVYWRKHYWQTYFSEEFLDSVLILTDIALSHDDQLAEAYVIRGNYYRNNNNKEQAINEYDKAIKFNPNDWEAYRGKGLLYLNNDLLKSIDNNQIAVSLYRGSTLPQMYYSLNIGYLHAGFKEKSIYYVKEGLKLDDDSAGYYSSLGEIEDCNGNFEKAIEYLGKSYAIDSTDHWVNYLLALDYMYLDQFEESLEYWRKNENRLKSLDRKLHTRSIFKIGYVYWVNGFKEEAENYFNTGLELHNQLIELDRLSVLNYRTFFSLASMHAFLGDKDKAYENLRLFNQRPMMPLNMIKSFKNDPLFDSIREEPEFQQIVRDVEAKYQAEHERVRKWLEENDML